MDKGFKSGFAALIGRTNVGKSTLMNKIIGQKIAITANKPQTTRNRIQTIRTTPEAQIIFVDTPGIHRVRNKLGQYMEGVAVSAIKDVDVILWLVEPSEYIGEGDAHIGELVKKTSLPVILIINKIDTVTREELVKVIDLYRRFYDFDEIIPVCARTGENIDKLCDLIVNYLPCGEKMFDEEDVTDQPERQIVAEIIREKAIHALDKEIPHGIAVTIEKMKYRKGIVDIEALITCERQTHRGIIIGKEGSMLKKIGMNARYEMERMLGRKVNLKLWVKDRKNWRDNEVLLKNFGYRRE